MGKLYGRCNIEGVEYLINILLLSRKDEPVQGEGTLLSLRSYFDFILESGLIRPDEVDTAPYRSPNLSVGKTVLAKGKISDKPEDGRFFEFAATLSLVSKDEITSYRALAELRVDYYFIITDFRGDDRLDPFSDTRFKCPFCSHELPYKSLELLTTFDGAATGQEDNVRTCPNPACSAKICISDDKEEMIKMVLYCHILGCRVSLLGGSSLANAERLSECIPRRIIKGLTIYNLEGKPEQLFYLYACRRRPETDSAS